MPENVFNVCVATAAKGHISSGIPVAEITAKLARSYRESFADDGFEPAMIETAELLLRVMADAPARIAGDTPFLWLRHFQYFVCKYEIDGSRKRWRLLNGAYFTGKKEPVLNRKQRFATAVAAFVIH
jgi:hypothetical protein